MCVLDTGASSPYYMTLYKHMTMLHTDTVYVFYTNLVATLIYLANYFNAIMLRNESEKETDSLTKATRVR